MSEKFKVTRQVHFDRPYHDGDIYEGDAGPVSHLIANGVLVPLNEKADAPTRNKAARKVQNKAVD